MDRVIVFTRKSDDLTEVNITLRANWDTENLSEGLCDRVRRSLENNGIAVCDLKYITRECVLRRCPGANPV